MKKTIFRIICFALLLTLILAMVNRIFRFKYSDGIYTAEKFYDQEKESVDVLILGSSHAYEYFNTGTLWDEHGMAAFIFAGSAQPMWNTYYFLKEALKTQTPKLIVLEGFRLAMQDEYAEDSRIIFNNYGLHWSKDKIESIKVSAPKDRWLDFLLEHTQYHSRYTEISREDFLPNKGNHQYDDWKGFGCNMETEAFKAKDMSGITDKDPIPEKIEYYYRKVLELARDNNIPITVIISPYPGIKKYEQRIFNTAEDIAAEYGVSFLNCNLILDEIGLDYETDAGDSSHINYRGNEKFTTYIGAYLKNNYDIPDRRGNAEYDSWQRSADYVRQMIYDQKLVDDNTLAGITEKIQNPNYDIIVSFDGNYSLDNEEVTALIQVLGIDDNAKDGIWYKSSDSIISIDENETFEKYISTPYHDIGIKRIRNGESDYYNEVIVDNDSYLKVTNGINIVIYDNVTDSLADSFGIDTDNENKIIR